MIFQCPNCMFVLTDVVLTEKSADMVKCPNCDTKLVDMVVQDWDKEVKGKATGLGFGGMMQEGRRGRQR